MNTEEFIIKANIKHNNKYSYIKTEYLKSTIKIIIICPVHGDFNQTSHAHLQGQGCKKCNNNSTKVNIELFLNKANKKHNSKYCYNKSIYMNSYTPIIITCPIHGEFLQTPKLHLECDGCRECGNERKKEKIEDFIRKANIKHDNKYSYNNTIYINTSTKINITCPIHGEFLQEPRAHLQGQGCKKCKTEKRKYTTEEFIEKSNIIHNFKYDYKNTIYKFYNEKVNILCKEHGIFKQTPDNHLSGKGCPICKSSKGEKAIIKFLSDNKINFITQFKNNNSKLIKNLRFDFYLPNNNLIIEYNGKQHYEPNKYFGGETQFKKTISNDIKKLLYCIKYKINFLEISYKEKNNIETILNDKLFNTI